MNKQAFVCCHHTIRCLLVPEQLHVSTHELIMSTIHVVYIVLINY